MNNAVIYARYSSASQNDMSIESQIRICKEHAEKQGLKVIHVYNDKAKSAFKDVDDSKRKEFRRMMADAETGAFQTIIVYMLDRFSRIKANSVFYKMQLKKHGVKVMSVREQITDDEGGEIYEMILEWNNEKYSQRLSKRVRDGLDMAVQKGTFTGGHILFGYKVEKDPSNTKSAGRVVLDEPNAEIIKFMFTEYAQGTDKEDIAKQLNAQGKKFNGKPFKGRTFDHWISNEKFTGTFKFGGRTCDSSYPAIIDRDTFDRVQARLQANQYSRAGRNFAIERYLLTGKLYCGHCGGQMVAESGKSHTGNVYKYYSCKKKNKSNCGKKNEKKETIEYWVVSELQNYLKKKNNALELCENLVNFHERKTDMSEIKSLEQQINHVQKQMEQALESMMVAESAVTKKMFDRKINDLGIDLENLETQHARLKLASRATITKESLMEFIAEFIDGDPHDKEFQEKVINRAINVVYVHDKLETVAYFNLPSTSEIKITKTDNDTALSMLQSTKGAKPDLLFSSRTITIAPPSDIKYEP